MKLLFCKKCGDAFQLRVNKDRSCECGAVVGRYTDELNAICAGKFALRFAIDNNSFFSRIGGNEEVNGIYDRFHGKGKVQCWIMEDKDSANYKTYLKISKKKYANTIHKH